MALCLAFSRVFSQSVGDTLRFSGINPLGSEVLRLRPQKRDVTILACLRSKELSRISLVTTPDHKKFLRDNEGNIVKYYPQALEFRVTAGTRSQVQIAPLDYQTETPSQDFPATLHFRLKVFHGVEAKTYAPAEAKIIGVPVEAPYPERIYRVRFQLPRIPAEDRMMLEVLDGKGERVTKFGFELL
jgi:hypothetical protein